MDFKTGFGNERDIEVPVLLEYIKQHLDINSALDVGCADNVYSSTVKRMVEQLDGIDLKDDYTGKRHYSRYIVGDVLKEKLDKYDLVFSISAIEHYGVKQNPVDNPLKSQIKMVRKIAKLAKKYVFLTFPYGQKCQVSEEFRMVDNGTLLCFLAQLYGFKKEIKFYSTDVPTPEVAWIELTQHEANQVKYEPSLGVQCVAMIRAERKDV